MKTAYKTLIRHFFHCLMKNITTNLQESLKNTMGCGMVSKDRGREAVDEQNIGGQSSNMPRWILQISCAEAPHPTPQSDFLGEL